MSAVAESRGATRATIRRRRSLALLVLLAVAAAAAVAFSAASGGGGASAPPAPPSVVRLELGGSTLAQISVRAAGRPAAIETALQQVPSHRVARTGKAGIVYAVDRAGAAAALRQAVANGGGSARVPERAVSSSIVVPLISQRLPDDCEATALAMVLGYAGRPVDQLTLQRQLAHAQPLDPRTAANGSEVWGDPSLGFVGRADGGGPAGGFGVYQRPVRALAQRHGIAMTDLTGAPADRAYAALLAGRPVLAWVALSAGPYASWTSPAGKPVQVNYGEHAVVLTGVGHGQVHVNDPLSGERLTWSKAEFEQMWAGLGHRALAAPAGRR
jgi:uncharacterized protein YvpB